MAKAIIPDQKEKKNYVLIVLDSSGSMNFIKDETIEGFNSNLETIKAETGDMDTKISLVTFNDPGNIKPIIWLKSVTTVEPLTEESYIPNNMTALYDAVGYTVKRFQEEVELNADDGVLLTIITDGQENSSKKWSQGKIKDLIGGLEAHPNWTTTFIGANQDVMLNAGNMGVDNSMNNNLSFAATSRGVRGMTASTNIGYENYFSARSKGITKVSNLYDGASYASDSEDN